MFSTKVATLIEFLFIIGILVLIATTIFSSYQKYSPKASAAEERPKLPIIEWGLEPYKVDDGIRSFEKSLHSDRTIWTLGDSDDRLFPSKVDPPQTELHSRAISGGND